MKVKLIRQARITAKAGEIVNVSPAEAAFLISTRSAVEVVDAAKETPVAPTKQNSTKKKG